LLSTSPAGIVALEAGSLAPGRPADVTVFNPDEEFDYTPARVQSKSKNTPFLGWRLPGVVRFTIVDGKIAYQG
jgi:dihydroorotase